MTPDRRIREAYDRIELDRDSRDRVWAALERASSPGEETQTVKQARKPIRILIIAAILTVLMVGSAYALSGIPASTGSHYMHGEGEYGSFEAIKKVEKTVGYPVVAVEEFSNGYVFDRVHVGGEAVFDENNEVLEEYYGVMLIYSRPDAPDLTVNLSPVLELEGGQEPPEPTEERELDDITLRLSLDHYKFVPPDYEKTEEDCKNEAAGHYYISFGTDEIEEYDYAFADFTLDKVQYIIMDTHANPDSFDTMAQMAAELIAAAKA